MENPKILVVDDESRMRKLVRDFLEKKGFVVREAGDGEEIPGCHLQGIWICHGKTGGERRDPS